MFNVLAVLWLIVSSLTSSGKYLMNIHEENKFNKYIYKYREMMEE